MNKVTIIGNLTRDAEIKNTPKGTAVAQVGIAVNRKWKSESGEVQEEVTFIDCELWGRQAEIVGEYARKGSKIAFIGRLKLDQWDDKATGAKRSKLKVVVEEVELLGTKPSAEREPQRDNPRSQTPTPKPPHDPDLDPQEDDIPF